ncbi:MAG: Dam family site-specific DNA-(adenine-N6)-methyltransferase, partial [Candidatus Izemoplasmatales bacterium]
YDTYYEPFLGGGALFFQLKPISAVVSDYNSELITAYNCFQDKEDYLLMIEEILKHQRNHSEEYYYQIREMDRIAEFTKLPNYMRAARMIYLNKACFNGLYRVNSKGFFNVPSGKYTIVNAYDETLYNNLSKYLSRSSIFINNDDFEKAVSSAKKGDFVYFDPPYDTFDEKNNFTTYTKNAFGKDEQKRLAKVFKDLDNRGVKVMLSNHNTEFIRELYSEFNIKVINARRSINSVSSGRGSVEEVIITNYILENTYDNN